MKRISIEQSIPALSGAFTGRAITRRRPRGGRRAGMTIIEVMIALAILLVTLAATTASQLSSRALTETAAETSTAMSDLQACMEQLMVENLDQLAIVGSVYEDSQPVAAFNGLHLQNEVIVATYPTFAGGATVPDPLEIVLTCTWRDHRGGTRQLQLATMKTR